MAPLACDSADFPNAGDAPHPNVLLYISDTLRADGLGCYGNEIVETPRIDQFAAEGMLFERAFAPSSWTRASMASIFTGTAPAVHGAQGRFDILDETSVMIAELFADEGYRVGNITTNRNVGAFFGFDQGYADGDFIELYKASSEDKVSVSELSTLADEVTRRATAWLESVTGPFCLIVHTIDPHSPYMPPGDWDRYGEGIPSGVDGSQQSLFRLQTKRSKADEARVVSLYYGEIAFNDNAFGELVDWLRENDLYDQTVVAFTSDHGEEFWERGERGHGKTLNEKSLHVPLILRFPGQLAGGSRIGRILGTVDLLPTLLDLARIEKPEWIDGHSILRPASNAEPTVFSSCKLSELDLYSARDERWRLVFDGKTGKKQLFDIEQSATNSSNVIGKNREVGRELFRRLAESMKRQDERRLALFGTLEALRADELPDDVNRDLEDLGYFDAADETDALPTEPSVEEH